MNVRILGAILALAATCAFADDGPNHYQNPGFDPNRDYLNHGQGEHIDPFTGSLQLTAVDASIPGNGGFGVDVIRSYSLQRTTDPSNYLSPYGFGWDIHFGRVRSGQSLCTTLIPEQTLVLELPDGNQQTLHKANASYGQGATSGDYLTVRLWKATCRSDQHALIVYSPGGTRYEMTERDEQGGYWLPTRIVGRNGQTADITYELQGTSPDNSWYRKAVKTVSLNGSLVVTFNYGGGKLTQVVSQGRTWTYNVGPRIISGAVVNHLDSVTTPENQVWNYLYYGDRGASLPGAKIQRVTNPWGGATTYDYRYQDFFTANGLTQRSPTVYTKQTTDGTWTFSYTPSAYSNAFDVTSVQLPASIGGGTIVYRHYGYRTVAVDGSNGNPGQSNNLWKIGLLYRKEQGSLQAEQFEWDFRNISSERSAMPGYYSYDETIRMPVLTRKTVTRDSGTYTTTYANHDAWGFPVTVSESFGGNQRSRSLIYDHKTSGGKWILGLVANEQITGVGDIGQTFDANGNVRIRTRFGVTTGFDYHSSGDMAGAVSTKTDANGHVTTYGSWYRGVAQYESRPEGVVITRDADDFGNMRMASDGESNWYFTYDSLNRLKSINYPVGSDATISWGFRKRTFTRSPYSEVTDYDEFGRVTLVTRNGVPTKFDFDPLGRKLFESLPGNVSDGTDYIYDAIGRVKTRSLPIGTRTFSYQSNGSVLITTERNFQETHSFDRYGDPDEGYPTGISTASNVDTTMGRDKIGNLTSVTQGGSTRVYTYNGKKFVTQISDPETGTTVIDPDNMGNANSRTVGGVQTTFDYDGLNRLKTTTYGGAAGTVTYGYNKRSQVTSVALNGGSGASRQYGYDANGNLIEDRLFVDGYTFKTTYTYSPLDAVSTIAYPTATGVTPLTLTFEPDNFGRATRVSPFASAVSYHNSGNLNSLSFVNNRVAQFGEADPRQLPTSMSISSVGGPAGGAINMTYQYDAGGNVHIIDGDLGTKTLTYDAVDRLTGASGPWGTGAVGYDGKGNITSHTYGPAFNTQLNYDTRNLLASVTGTHPVSTIQHDPRGNMTKRGPTTFQYDNASALTCVNCGTMQQIRYGYDGRGWRVWEEKAGVKTYFFHAMNGDLLFEYTPTYGFWKQHAYLGGKRIATRSNDRLPVTITWESTFNPPGDPTGPVVLLKVRVRPATGASIPTGSIRFFQFEGAQGTAPLVDGVATLSSDLFACGTYPTVAEYSGDDWHQAKSTDPGDNKTYQFPKCAAHVQLSADPPNSQAEGQVVTLTGRAPGEGTHGVPTGTFTFYNGTLTLGTLSLGPTGQASLPISTLPVGANSLSVKYSGDTTYGPGTATLPYTITGTPNVPPVVSMDAPEDGTTVPAGTIVTLAATASDPDGSIAGVVFMDNGTPVPGSVSAAGTSYSMPWSTSIAGPHALSAVARDDRGRETVSSTRTVNVVCSTSNALPVATITSPVQGTLMTGPLSVTIAATASDPDGLVAKVEFFNQGVKLGESTIAPYTYTWDAVGAGDYSVYAVATDQCNATGTSPAVDFTVEQGVGIVNGSFEDPVASAGTYLAVPPSGWTASPYRYLMTSAYLVATGRPGAREGQQVALVYDQAGGWLKQSVYLPAGSYVVRGQAMGGSAATLRVKVDGVERGQTNLAILSWKPFATSTITMATAGTHDVEISVAAGGGSLYLDDIQIVNQLASVSVAFQPASITIYDVGRMNITLTNSSASAITGVAFSAPYPAGLVNANATNATSSCGGTVTAAPGAGGLALSEGTLPAGGACTVSVDVTSSTAGTYMVSTGRISTTSAAQIEGASSTLRVWSELPELQGSAGLNGSGTITFPPDALPTDWLVMYVVSITTVPTPAGWTLSTSLMWDPYGCCIYSSVFTRQVGTATDVALTTTNGGAVMASYRNVSGIGAVGAFALSADAGSVAMPPSITPQSAGSLVIGIVADRDPVNPIPPSDFASHVSYTMTYFGHNIAGKFYGSTAPTGSPAWTQQPGPYAAVAALLELKPATLLPSAAFSPPSIGANGVSVLTVTLTSGKANATTGVGFNDTYPAGLVNATPANAATTCGGTLTASDGGSGITLANATVPAVGSCTVTVRVTSTSPASYTNATGQITTSRGNLPGASAALTVLANPTAAMAFNPASIESDQTSTLTVTIGNPNSVPLTSASFVNIYPTGLVNATLPAASTTCPGGVVTAVGGAGSLGLASASLPASGTCTVSVKVRSATSGSYANVLPAGSVTTANGGSNASSAVATLTVSQAPPRPQFIGSTGLNGSGTLNFPAGTVSTDWLVMYVVSISTVPTPAGWTLSTSLMWDPYGCCIYSSVFTRQVGTATDVALTTTNGGAVMASYRNVSGIGAVGAFALSADAGSVAMPPSITPQSAGSLVIGIVADRDPVNPIPPSDFASHVSYTMTYFGHNIAGKFYGSTAPTGSPAWTQQPGPYAAVAALLELKAATLDATESFSPATIATGDASVMTITFTNSLPTAVTGLGFNNAYPAGLVNAPAANATTTCGGTVTATGNGSSLSLSGGSVAAGGSCTVSVNVTSASPGTYANPVGPLASSLGNIAGPTASLTVRSHPSIAMAFSPTAIDTNQTSTLTLTLTNPNAAALTGASFSNAYPAGLANAAVPAATSTCGGTLAAPAGGATVGVSGATIPASGSCTVSVKVRSASAGSYSNAIGAGGLTTANGGANMAPAAATLTVIPAPLVPTFVGSATLNGSGTLNFPAGTVSTDWLVMYVVSISTVPTPAGWTLSTSLMWDPYGCCIYSSVFTRQAGSAANVSVTTTIGGAVMASYRNVSGIGAVGAFALSADAGSVAMPPSITPQSAGSLVIGIVADRDPVNPIPPSDFASHVSYTMTYFGHNIAGKFFGSTAPTGSPVWTQQAGPYASVAVLIELKP